MVAGVMPKTTRKPSGQAAKTPTRVIGLRLPDLVIARIESNYQSRRRSDPECPAIYNVADHIRYLIDQGLRWSNY